MKTVKSIVLAAALAAFAVPALAGSNDGWQTEVHYAPAPVQTTARPVYQPVAAQAPTMDYAPYDASLAGYYKPMTTAALPAYVVPAVERPPLYESVRLNIDAPRVNGPQLMPFSNRPQPGYVKVAGYRGLYVLDGFEAWEVVHEYNDILTIVLH